MRESKRKRLESKGWKVGAAKEFLELSDEEAADIELRLRLAEGLKACWRSERQIGNWRQSSRGAHRAT